MTVSAPTGLVRGRRRLVFWVGIAALAALGVLIGFLATVGTAKDTSRWLGQPAPAITGQEVGTQKTITLSSFAGRWVLVNFSASWCPGCRTEMPQLRDFARAAPSYDAMVITVEEDPTDAAALHRYLTSQGGTWPVVQDPVASVDYGVSQIPASFLVDPDGIVVTYFPSGLNAGQLEGIIRSDGQAAS